MDDDERDRPTTNQPLNAERRPLVTPILALVGLVVLVAVIVLALTWVRYNAN